jgi:membrane protein implicated in regulation of membrane protease activity
MNGALITRCVGAGVVVVADAASAAAVSLLAGPLPLSAIARLLSFFFLFLTTKKSTRKRGKEAATTLQRSMCLIDRVG